VGQETDPLPRAGEQKVAAMKRTFGDDVVDLDAAAIEIA
jgi:hypothetical protein